MLVRRTPTEGAAIGTTSPRRPAMAACLALALALASALLASGCGASARELRDARVSVYETDYAEVYNQVLAAVRERYPDFVDEDAARGRVRTPWFPVPLATEQGGVAETPSAIASATGAPAGVRYFVRFDIAIRGGPPWQVRVDGQASSWEAGQPLPVPLTGRSEPPWLSGRVDGLRVAIHDRLRAHAVVPAEADESAAPAAAAPAAASEAGFAALPADAAAVARAVLAAARARNYDALAGHMDDAFEWSPGAAPSARVALGVWRADPERLVALIAALEAGCALADDGASVTCPAGDAAAAGARARFVRRGQRWRFAAFLATP